MRRAKLHFGVVVLILVALLMGACTGQEKPEGALTVAELLEDQVYDREVKIYGEVGLFGELFYPCLELTSGERTLVVWYDLMTENDGTIRPVVSVEEISNGNQVTIKGELKGEGGVHYSKGDFWAVEINKTVPTPAKYLEIRLSPIHEVRVNIAESYPPQVIVYIKGGLSDGCTTFHELTTQRNGNVINIQVTTQRPKEALCTQVYSYFEKNVNLGSDFVSGETYTINVNDYNTSFEMQ